jgi:hypothetical protein
MADRKLAPAFKHGAYSGLRLLPGEDQAAFEKLRADLIAEFTPVGRLEEDIVETMACLTWRKNNLLTYCLAQYASNRWSEIKSERYSSSTYPGLGVDAEETNAMLRADKNKAQVELGGTAWKLIEINEVATTAHLLHELSVVDRIDGMIDRCLKRLLFVRGLKSI